MALFALLCIIAFATEIHCQDAVVITRAPDEITYTNCTATVALTCVAQGSALTSVEWRKLTPGGSNTTEGALNNITELDNRVTVTESIRAFNNGTKQIASELEIGDVMGGDAGVYECLAEAGNGKSAARATSRVMLMECQPMVSPSFSSVAALMGTDVVVTFAIGNAHPPVETGDISWRFTRIGYFIHLVEELERNDPRLSRDRLSLTLKNISDDQGNYTMTATNSAGSGTGTTYLDLESAPHDFRPSFTEFEDDIAVFVCLMFGDPPPVPSWTFTDAILTSSDKHFMDSFIYDDNPEFPYEFEVFARLAVYDAYRDHETDSGEYTCIGHNMHGEASTSIPFYPVPASPVVTPVGSSSLVEIATRDIVSGTAILAFEVSSAVPPVRLEDLTWSFTSDGGGADVLLDYQASLPRHSFSSDRLNLYITNLSVGDAGLYCLTATNLAGSNSSSIHLTVFVEPQLAAGSGNSTITLKVKQNATLTCSADGKPQPVIAWLHNGSLVSANQPDVSITAAAVPGERDRALAGTESTLTISNLTLSDAGEYSCRAYSEYGTADILGSPFILKVNPEPIPPVVTPIGSSNLEAVSTRDIVSGTAVLAFEVSSALPPVRLEDLTWSFTSDGGGADVLLDYQASLPRHSFSSDRLNLSIANLSVGDAGLYSLTAANLAGSNSSSINLTVFVEPQLADGIESTTFTLKVKQNATLTCSADGKPQPAIAWLHNGSLVSANQPDLSITAAAVPGERDRALAGTESTLTISNLTLSDAGEYSCRAYAEYGTADILGSPFILRVTPAGGSAAVGASMIAVSLLLVMNVVV